MVLTKQNVGRFGYTVGVLVTGAFLFDSADGFADPLLWVVMTVAAVIWVAYYNRIMIPRFEYFENREENEEDDLTPPGM